MVSPAPSQDLSTPTSSNARSPATDPEWYTDPYSAPQIHDDVSFPNDMFYLSQELETICTGRPQMAGFAEQSGYPCVNLSQVQGFIDQEDFAESQDDAFESDDRYLDMDQNEFSIEVDPRPLRADQIQTSSRRSFARNERLGVPKELASVQEQVPLHVAADGEGDLEDEDEIIEDEASDTDYTPKATRSSKRRSAHSSKSLSSSSARRGRAMKSKSLRSPKSKLQSALACRTCKASFNDTAALQRHVDNSHPRAFTCVFNFAGCSSTFASKNEWKRHVATQHLNFNTWVCNLDNCGSAQNASSSSPKTAGGQSGKGATFNRKDLFTQHLRRMHAPAATRRKLDKQKAEWDEKIRELQKSCIQVNRQGPKALKCPVVECGFDFSGSKCWDDRMEHVAKHLEKVASTRGSASVQHENDEQLVNWALNEGIIELADGVYKLIPIAAWLEVLDQDAEGEDEY